MYVEASGPAGQFGAVSVGTPVHFNVAGYPDRTFAGRIERVNPAADPTTRQVPVFIAIENGDGRLVAGLFAEGRVGRSSGPTLLVPGAAIERTGNSIAVVRLSAGLIERRPVEI